MPTLTLSGCAPVPLAHYLKALGIFRVVAKQVDAAADGAWRNDAFVLNCELSESELKKFFLQSYRPTPILAPWNAGSGFYFQEEKSKAKDPLTGKKIKTGLRTQETAATRVVDSVATSSTARLAEYRHAIEIARAALNKRGWEEAPQGEDKSNLISELRSLWPDATIPWLDCATILVNSEGPEARTTALKATFPPLMGTGANDGNTDFTSNFMQRLCEVIEFGETTEPFKDNEHLDRSAIWLTASLFGGVVPGAATKAAIGQFIPGCAGGPNTSSGFDGPSFVNPWDFVLMIEGALLFSSAAIKRLESGKHGSFAAPFFVRSSGVGYASAADDDETKGRGELWAPIWTNRTSLNELNVIFSEARVNIGNRSAKTGIDFTRAIVSLGVDQGISAFQRFSFCQRNGKNYFATPLNRVVVRRNARADLLSDVDQWHECLRRKAGPQANPAAPASVARSLNLLERAILDLCSDGSSDSVQAVIISLGQTERALAKSLQWSIKNYLRPLCRLRSEWLRDGDTNSAEFRLAASLAGMRAFFGIGKETLWLRQHLEPLEIVSVKDCSWVKWAERPGNDVVWHEGDLTEALNDILARRIIRVEKAGVEGWPDWSPRYAELEDITAFIEGRTDDTLIADLLWGLSLIDWQTVERELQGKSIASEFVPSSFYALLKLCFRPKGENKTIPLVPAIHHRARSGDGLAASQLAARRLRGSGYPPLVEKLPVAATVASRTAAALLFPVSPRALSLLEQFIINQPEIQNA